jgi:hypothetical protein
MHVYPGGPLTAAGTSPEPEYQGVYWASCVGVALDECRLHPRNLHFVALSSRSYPSSQRIALP